MPKLAVFRLRNSSDAVVGTVHDRTGRCVARSAHPGETVSDVVLFVPSGCRTCGFIAAAESPGSIQVYGDPLFAPILSTIIERQGAADTYALRSPLASLYVSAAPVQLAVDASLTCNRAAVAEWELFRFEPRDQATIHRRTIFLFRQLEMLFRSSLTLAGMLAWLDRVDPATALACSQAVLRLLGRDDLSSLAAALLGDAALLARLQSVVPANPWLDELLPGLLRWTETRAPEPSIELDETHDRLAAGFDWDRVAHAAEVVHVLAREHVEPKRELCVIATARNEGIYLLEWIAHYRALGVEHFIIYSNNNDDGSDLLLERLAGLGLITWVRNEGAGIDFQARAYAHCLSHLHRPLDYRWALVVDLDEFLVLNLDRHRSLPDFLRIQGHRGAEAIAFNWLVYTPTNQIAWHPAPLIRRFVHREMAENRLIKTAFMPRLHVASYPHNPVPSFRRTPIFLNASGALHHGPGSVTRPHEGEPHLSDAWIAHFYFKSVEEFIWKISRGPSHDMHKELHFESRRLLDYLHWFDGGEQVEDLRALPHLGSLVAQLGELRAVSGLRDAEDLSRQRFRQRITAMKARLREEIPSRLDLKPTDKDRMLRVLTS